MYSMCNPIIYSVRETKLVNIRTAENPLRLWTSDGDAVMFCVRPERVKAAVAARSSFPEAMEFTLFCSDFLISQ